MIALEESIEKWKKIANGDGVDNGVEDCALCKLHRRNLCTNCPIQIKTSNRFCKETPYDEWSNHQYNIHGKNFSRKVHENCDECKRIANAELKFLISL